MAGTKMKWKPPVWRGEKLREFRKDASLTQVEVLEQLNDLLDTSYTAATYSNWERNIEPRMRCITAALGRVLGCAVEDFYEED